MLAILLAAVIGPFTLVQTTERGDYYILTAKPKLKVDAAACEDFLADAEQLTGVRVPRFSYYRVETPSEVSQFTGAPFAGGIARPDPLRTWVASPCLKHELAHFVAYQFAVPTDDNGDAFWHEGFAGWLAGDYGFFDRWNLRQYLTHTKKRKLDVPWAIASIRRRVPNVDERRMEYRIANAFTHFLVKEYGLEKYFAFFRLMGTMKRDGQDHGNALDDGAFLKVYGMSIQTASERWLD